MSSSFTPFLDLELMSFNAFINSWGDHTNNNFTLLDTWAQTQGAESSVFQNAIATLQSKTGTVIPLQLSSGATLSLAPVTLTGNFTEFEEAVTGISSTVGLIVGSPIEGLPIPPGSYLKSIDSGTQISLSQAATETTSAATSFTAAPANATGYILTGALTSPATVELPQQAGLYAIVNQASGANVNLITSAGGSSTGALLVIGQNSITLSDGTNVYVLASSTPVGVIGEILFFSGPTPPEFFLQCDGSAISRTTYASLMNAITFTFTGDTTQGSFRITNCSSLANVAPGLPLEGFGVSPAVIVEAIIDSSTIQVNFASNATATGTTIRAFPYDNGDGGNTFNLPDPRGLFIRALDLGKGYDNNRVLGSLQADGFGDHLHPVHVGDIIAEVSGTATGFATGVATGSGQGTASGSSFGTGTFTLQGTGTAFGSGSGPITGAFPYQTTIYSSQSGGTPYITALGTGADNANVTGTAFVNVTSSVNTIDTGVGVSVVNVDVPVITADSVTINVPAITALDFAFDTIAGQTQLASQYTTAAVAETRPKNIALLACIRYFGSTGSSGSGGAGGPAGGGKVVDMGTVGASAQVDLNYGSVFKLVLSQPTCSLTFAVPGTFTFLSIVLRVTQSSGGSNEISWPENVGWNGGFAPSLSSAPGAVDYVQLVSFDAGSTWEGTVAISAPGTS